MWKYVLPPVVLVALLWLLMSSGTTYYLHWLESTYRDVLDEHVASIRVADNLQRSLRRLDRKISEIGDDAPVEVDTFKPFVAELVADHRRLTLLARNSDVQRKITQLGRILLDIKERLELTTEPMQDGAEEEPPRPPIQWKGASQIREIVERAGRSNVEVAEMNQILIDRATTRQANIGRMINACRFVFLCTGPLLGVWFGWRLSSKLQSSVGRVAVILRQAEEGDIKIGDVTVQSEGLLENLQHQASCIVTRLQEAHRDLEVARREVVRSERLAAVGQLAAGVAHEIRNPLTSVKLLLQHAGKQQSPAQLNDEKLELILDEIGRVESIIERLLDLSRLKPLHRTKQSIVAIIQRAASLVDVQSQHQGVLLDLPIDHGVFIDGDCEQLHQVFTNLFINAVEAMPEGGHLRVTLTQVSENVRIEIADTGDGIHPSVMPQLFQPFVTSKERGTGLGLAVSRRIVEQHGGTLTARNAEPGGAIFTVSLPAKGRDQCAVRSLA